MFCKKCGSLMVPSKGLLVCTTCSYKTKSKLKLGEKGRTDKKILEGGVYSVNPVVNAKCRKCGNNEAYYAFKQTRSGDEAPTKFFRCTQCGFTWRQYD